MTTDPLAAAEAEFPELRLLADLRCAGWTFTPAVVDGEVAELHGVRAWPDDWVDTIVVRFTTDTTGLRCDRAGGIVWHRAGSLVDVVDGLLALPPPRPGRSTAPHRTRGPGRQRTERGEIAMRRRAVLDRLAATVTAGRPVIGAGAGTGLSAKAAEAGGVDLLIIYNSGRYRMAGRGSLAGLLPYGDANAIVVEMAGEVLPVVRDTPVLAGVCGTDPFRLMGPFLDDLRRLGFSGVQNFPTVGLYDGTFRENLEQTGMGFGLEVDMIRLAAEKDLLTAPYAFDPDQAAAMAAAGADILVPHVGLTGRGTIGATSTLTLDEAAAAVQAMRDAAVAVDRDILVLCHGGPIAEPGDAQYVLDHTEGIAGFFGASSVERLPTEVAVRAQAEAFKSLRV